MEILDRIPTETAREYALRVLKHNIIYLHLSPGDIVSEYELAKKVGLSRTPFREALMELGKSGIVEILPQKGSLISLIDDKMVEDARFLRLVLEKSIIELLCDKNLEFDIRYLKESIALQEFHFQQYNISKFLELDNEFHKILFKICNKERIYNLISIMEIHFDRVRGLALSQKKFEVILNEHKEILECIEKNNKKMALKALSKHLEGYTLEKDGLRKEYPEYFK